MDVQSIQAPSSSISAALRRIDQVVVPITASSSDISPFAAPPPVVRNASSTNRMRELGHNRSNTDQVRLGVRLIQIDMRPSAREGGRAHYNAEEEEGRNLGIDQDPKLTASIVDPQCIVKCEEVRKVSRHASSIHNDNEAEADEIRAASSSTT